jgi:hypothetical protein
VSGRGVLRILVPRSVYRGDFFDICTDKKGQIELAIGAILAESSATQTGFGETSVPTLKDRNTFAG